MNNRKICLDAYAKINLALDVTGLRSNGYHEVDMVMQTISLHDVVEIELKEEPGITLSTNLSWLPVDSRNIAYKAAKLMLSEYPGIKNTGVGISITKNIPVAAGMAGGSTDGAAVLRGLNELLELGLDNEELMGIGVKLGADVPFCICGGTMHSEGIGEILTPLPPMPDCFILTAKPGYSVSTREVYEGIDGILFAGERENYLDNKDGASGDKEKATEKQEGVSGNQKYACEKQEGASHNCLQGNMHVDVSAMIGALENNSIKDIARNLGNVLELYTAGQHRDISDIKEIMLETGAIGALMSGSGPTVFGLFENEASAQKAGMSISNKYPKCSVNVSVPVNAKL